MRTYEYAGFHYEIIEHPVGEYRLIGLPGQHPAAYKDRHLRNALASFLEEQKCVTD